MKGDSITYVMLKEHVLGIVSGSDGIGRDFFTPAMWFCIALAIIQLLFAITDRRLWMALTLGFGGGILMFLGNVLPFRLDSALVGFVFFMTGVHCKSLFWKLSNLSVKKLLILYTIFTLVLILSGLLNLDFQNRQCLSINAMYFGPYPLLFIVSGVTGTVMLMIVAVFLERIKFAKHFVIEISTGTIVVLGFHKIIAIIMKDVITIYSVPVALAYSVFNLFICYIIIRLSSSYFPILLGNRKCNNVTKDR